MRLRDDTGTIRAAPDALLNLASSGILSSGILMTGGV
jgi:hypothetical protein